MQSQSSPSNGCQSSSPRHHMPSMTGFRLTLGAGETSGGDSLPWRQLGQRAQAHDLQEAVGCHKERRPTAAAEACIVKDQAAREQVVDYASTRRMTSDARRSIWLPSPSKNGVNRTSSAPAEMTSRTPRTQSSGVPCTPTSSMCGRLKPAYT